MSDYLNQRWHDNSRREIEQADHMGRLRSHPDWGTDKPIDYEADRARNDAENRATNERLAQLKERNTWHVDKQGAIAVFIFVILPILIWLALT